ncbi:hypothetical protein SO802_017675 [Lithocarpus litseifolius]|uniref:Uncharacterized protein n=1 Tax=Lithocarpus litseifolius TaxID=425828 RepID=A0AAW2CL15_9ROSI
MTSFERELLGSHGFSLIPPDGLGAIIFSNPQLLLPSKFVLAYARKQTRSAIFKWVEEKRGWLWNASDYPAEWEKKVKDEPEPISVYHPTAEEISASMGTSMKGFFNGANVRFGAATPAPPAAVVKDGSSLVVTPSSIPSSATRGLDADLSSEGSEDVLEDSDDEPTIIKRVSNSKEEEGAEHEAKFIGPLPTASSQFEVGSSSTVVLDPMSEVTAFFARFDQSEVNDLDTADF